MQLDTWFLEAWNGDEDITPFEPVYTRRRHAVFLWL